MFHGVTLAAAVWAPWVADIPGYRAHLVELPGHGLSGPFTYRAGAVREHAVRLIDEVFDALDLPVAPVVAHSLGGMFALWHAADRPGRIASLVAIGEPAVALPGARVRMPLSAMTVPVLGATMLRTPTPKWIFRRLLGQGLSPVAAAGMPDELVEVLHMAVRRKGNARTVASLMHAINLFRRPRVRQRHERRRPGPDLDTDVVLPRADRSIPTARPGPSVDRQNSVGQAPRSRRRPRTLAGEPSQLRQVGHRAPQSNWIRGCPLTWPRMFGVFPCLGGAS